ncbi:MAG: IS630 family transposase [Methylococcaceae bacterium]
MITFSKELLTKLRASLLTAFKLKNIQAYRLATALICYGEGRGIKEIAILFGINCKTVGNWLLKFMSGGIDWVMGKHYHGRGRKEKLTKAQQKQLCVMVTEGPEAHGFSSGIWNCAMIAELIVLKFSVCYNLNYLASLLKKLGLSYQKARFISDRQDEEKYELARKVWLEETLPALLKKAKEENAVVLFGDEVSFAMWGSLARTWAPIGQQPTVKTRGIRKGLKMFGTIELGAGSFQYRQLLACSLQPKSLKLLKLLKEAALPAELLTLLKTLKGELYATEFDFLTALKEIVDEKLMTTYQEVILKHTEAAGKFNGLTYIEFLKQLLAHYDGKIFLVEDGAPYHHSKIVNAFKILHADRLTITPLPAYSPDYNPIEKLWKNTKRDATHLKYFKTFEDLHDSIVKAFKSYMQDASKVICVMQKMREDFAIAC